MKVIFKKDYYEMLKVQVDLIIERYYFVLRMIF